MTLTLSLELSTRIASFLSHRRRDLHALALTSHAFHQPAEARLYAHIVLTDPHRLALLSRTFRDAPRLLAHVIVFGFNPDTRRGAGAGGGEVSRVLWAMVRRWIRRMRGLKVLVVADVSFANSWIFEPGVVEAEDDEAGEGMGDGEGERGGFPFVLRELKVTARWTAHFALFLESNAGREVRYLQMYDDSLGLGEDTASAGDTLLPLPALQSGSLGKLETFNGSYLIAARLLCPSGAEAPRIQYLQAIVDVPLALPSSKPAVDKERAPPPLHALLTRLAPTLLSLSLIELAEHDAPDVLEVVARMCPGIRHVGVLPLPVVNRHKFHGPLLSLSALQSMDIDLTRWLPAPGQARYGGNPTPHAPTSTSPSPSTHPSTPIAQKLLATELKMYCPSLRIVHFWIGTHRFRWAWAPAGCAGVVNGHGGGGGVGKGKEGKEGGKEGMGAAGIGLSDWMWQFRGQDAPFYVQNSVLWMSAGK